MSQASTGDAALAGAEALGWDGSDMMQRTARAREPAQMF